MITPESIAQMEADSEWKPWAEKGWTLHQTPDRQVIAVNVAGHMAIERAKHLVTLVRRLEKGAFSYKEFTLFKKLHTP